MSQPFIGEIRMFGGNFAPAGWAFCNGQLMAIAQNETLFTLIGTTYGGDGQTTFALPDLRGRVPIHQGPGFVLGQLAGEESVTLTINQIPLHGHALPAFSGLGTQASPQNAVAWAATSGKFYSSAAPGTPMYNTTPLLKASGGSQPHENRMPVLAVNFILALFGVFPSQN